MLFYNQISSKMIEFIITIIVIIICCLLFGKADTKRNILNEVGLDLSEDCYTSKKEAEFARYCKKAIRIASDNFRGNTEKEFISFVLSVFDEVLYEHSSIGVKSHYVDFAHKIIYRRINDISHNNNDSIQFKYNFSDNRSRNRYINWIWEKYQYPWPKDWLKTDSF